MCPVHRLRQKSRNYARTQLVEVAHQFCPAPKELSSRASRVFLPVMGLTQADSDRDRLGEWRPEPAQQLDLRPCALPRIATAGSTFSKVRQRGLLTAIEKLGRYALRWKIETFLRTLKSGCKAEASTQHTTDRRANLIFVVCILPWHIGKRQPACSPRRESARTAQTPPLLRSAIYRRHPLHGTIGKHCSSVFNS